MLDRHYRISISTPTGWLISSNGRLALFFFRDPKSLKRLPRVLTQLWYADNGMPTRLKNIRRLDLSSAIDAWNDLLSNGWIIVDYHKEEVS